MSWSSHCMVVVLSNNLSGPGRPTGRPTGQLSYTIDFIGRCSSLASSAIQVRRNLVRAGITHARTHTQNTSLFAGILRSRVFSLPLVEIWSNISRWADHPRFHRPKLQRTRILLWKCQRSIHRSLQVSVNLVSNIVAKSILNNQLAMKINDSQWQ